MPKLHILLAALLLTPALAAAQACKVTSVHDGDSMRVRCAGQKNTLAIRIHQIDAPELNQAHGKASRDYLRRLCPIRSTAVLTVQGKDQYGRSLASVRCSGTDVAHAMVGAGQAWVYDYHAQDSSLYRLQNKAKANREGLWRSDNAVEPWKFRRDEKENK